MRARRPRTATAVGSRRHVVRSWSLLAVGALVLTGCATGELPQDFLNPDGPIAKEQDRLWNIVFPIAVIVFVGVQAGLLYSIFKFRARRTDDPTAIPKQVAGNTRLEVLWTLVPAIILVVIAVPTVRTIVFQSQEPDDALQVRVIGKQYWWEFEYDEEVGEVVTAHELHVPVDRPVYLTMDSPGQQITDPNGVIHSFWVPKLAGKQDVVPGHERRMTILADKPGTYSGQCAEFCGLSHANMRFVVVAHEAGEWEQWVEEQQAPAPTATDDLAAQGEELFTSRTCIACHAINGYEGAEARVGPNLTHFNARDKFAGYVFDTHDDELLADWLADPPAMKPGAQMPNLGLQPDDIDALIAYLRTLE